MTTQADDFWVNWYDKLRNILLLIEVNKELIRNKFFNEGRKAVELVLVSKF